MFLVNLDHRTAFISWVPLLCVGRSRMGLLLCSEDVIVPSVYRYPSEGSFTIACHLPCPHHAYIGVTFSIYLIQHLVPSGRGI